MGGGQESGIQWAPRERGPPWQRKGTAAVPQLAGVQVEGGMSGWVGRCVVRWSGLGQGAGWAWAGGLWPICKSPEGGTAGARGFHVLK